MADIDVRALLLGWRGAKPTGNIPSYLIGKKIADIATVESSGPVAHTSHGKGGAPLKKLVVQIKARQAGSGDPSPENEREISGWTGASVWLAADYDPTSEAAATLDWTDEAGTVYGGKIDALAGEMTINMAGVDLGSLDWTAQALSGGRTAFCTPISGLPYFPRYSTDSAPNAIAPVAKATYENASAWGYNSFLFTHSSGILPNQNLCFLFLDSEFANAAAFKTAMNGQYFVYEIYTPQTVQITPIEPPTTVAGENYVWADSGDVDVIFSVTP